MYIALLALAAVYGCVMFGQNLYDLFTRGYRMTFAELYREGKKKDLLGIVHVYVYLFYYVVAFEVLVVLSSVPSYIKFPIFILGLAQAVFVVVIITRTEKYARMYNRYLNYTKAYVDNVRAHGSETLKNELKKLYTAGQKELIPGGAVLSMLEAVLSLVAPAFIIYLIFTS